MELKDIKDILQVLGEQDFTEFELEQEGVKLRIRRAQPAPAASAAHVGAPVVSSGGPHLPVPGPTSGVPQAQPAPARAEAVAVAAEEDLFVIKSPIVGTFYRTPAPNAPPYVSVGDRIRVGQVLCIVEAMKLMNEIEAEVTGELVRIHKDTGQPVQFGEALFSIRPER